MQSNPIIRTITVEQTPRLLQLAGMFDFETDGTVTQSWQPTIDLTERDWSIGLIVGASGAGKSTIVKEMWGEQKPHNWRESHSLVDDFPDSLSIKEITEMLSSVGFNSPPSWVKPYHILSTGEQFRVDVARSAAESQNNRIVIDEFTSTVDRRVAKIGSAAIAKYIRRHSKQFVAATCHYDVIDWLQPDWLYEPHTDNFVWRSHQQRPNIDLVIVKGRHTAWRLFGKHHYLSDTLNKSAHTFIAYWNDEPVALSSWLYQPHASYKQNFVTPIMREHRTVCLPDYQGVSIGSNVSEQIASMWRALGFRARSTTSHPAMIGHRRRSKVWKEVKKPSFNSPTSTDGALRDTTAFTRITASFQYTGDKMNLVTAQQLSQKQIR